MLSSSGSNRVDVRAGVVFPTGRYRSVGGGWDPKSKSPVTGTGTSLLQSGAVVGDLALVEPTIGALVQTILAGSAVTAFAYGGIPLLTYEDRAESRKLYVSEDDAIKWTLAGVVSCIPYFNWLAWVLVGIDNDESFPFFTLALLYATPFLMGGFDAGPFAIFMFLSCVAHIQVERMVNTEPDSLANSMKDKESVLGAFRAVTSSLFTSISELMGGVTIRAKALDSKIEAGKVESANLKDSTVMEMVDAEMKSGERELRNSKELADVEKSIWDKSLGQRGNGNSKDSG